MRVLHSVERYCVCTAQTREARVYTAQCREALCVYCTVWRGTVYVLYSLEWCVCVLHSEERCMCVLHSVEGHCVCTAQSGEALSVYSTVYRVACVYCTV